MFCDISFIINGVYSEKKWSSLQLDKLCSFLYNFNKWPFFRYISLFLLHSNFSSISIIIRKKNQIIIVKNLYRTWWHMVKMILKWYTGVTGIIFIMK
jgi:hypothetical protein